MCEVLLFGGTGKLGSKIRENLAIYDLLLYAPTRQECDLRDVKKVDETIRRFAPDIIINAAAETRTDPQASVWVSDEGFKVNHLAVRPMVKWVNEDVVNRKLIHISSAWVGRDILKPEFDSIETAVEPENPYAASKWRAELDIVHKCQNYRIYRTNKLFDGNDDFVSEIIEGVKNKLVVLPWPQIPQQITSAESLANYIMGDFFEENIDDPPERTICHYASENTTTYYDIALYFMRVLWDYDVEFEIELVAPFVPQVVLTNVCSKQDYESMLNEVEFTE